MHIKLIRVINLNFSLINPVLGLLSSIFYINKERKFPVISLALAISIIYVYQPIPWDVRSIYYRVNFYSYDGLNLYTYFISIMQNIFGMEYMHAVWLILFLSMLLMLDLSNKYIREGGKGHSVFLLFVFFLILINVRYSYDLNRTYLAIILSLYYVYYSQTKCSIRVFLLFAIFIHPFSLVVFLSWYISKSKLVSINIYFLIFLLTPFFSYFFVGILYAFVTNLNYDILSKLMLYMNSENERFSSNIIFYAITFLRYIAVLLFLFVFLFLSRIKNSEQNVQRDLRLALILSILYGVFMFNGTISERLFMVLSIYFALLFFKYKMLNNIGILLILPFFLVHFTLMAHLGTVLYTSKYNEVITDERSKINFSFRSFYYPTLFLFDIESYGYSNKFISEETRL